MGLNSENKTKRTIKNLEAADFCKTCRSICLAQLYKESSPPLLVNQASSFLPLTNLDEAELDELNNPHNHERERFDVGEDSDDDPQ